MDFRFSEEEQAVADLARQILADQVTNERLKDIESKPEVFDAEVWTALADSNLLGVAIPEAYGGSGLGYLALCLLLHEVGRHVAPVPAYGALALGALALTEFGDEAEKSEWLPRVAAGGRRGRPCCRGVHAASV